MNELIFLLHILCLIGAIYVAAKLGKEALSVASVLQVILANLFVTKEIVLFSIHVTPTDAYTLGSLLALNILQEKYGKAFAKKVFYMNSLFLIFFVIMAIFQISYYPSSVDTMHASFVKVLSVSPRIFIASLITFFLSQRLDLFLYQKLRKHFSLPLSFFFSLSISQAFDTALFSYLGLFHIVTSIFSIACFSYLMKMISVALMTPFTLLFQKVSHEV